MELIHEIFFGSFLAKASTNKPVFGAIGATLVFMKQPTNHITFMISIAESKI